MDTPLYNNALFQCWIKFILYIQIIRLCLKAISYNGVSLKKQRFYFLPIHHFRLVRSFFYDASASYIEYIIMNTFLVY